jgi:hypothetical protein
MRLKSCPLIVPSLLGSRKLYYAIALGVKLSFWGPHLLEIIRSATNRVYGPYAAAGVHVEIPIFNVFLYSAMSHETDLRAGR